MEAQENGQEKEVKDGYITVITKRQGIDRKCGLFFSSSVISSLCRYFTKSSVISNFCRVFEVYLYGPLFLQHLLLSVRPPFEHDWQLIECKRKLVGQRSFEDWYAASARTPFLKLSYGKLLRILDQVQQDRNQRRKSRHSRPNSTIESELLSKQE